jgi:dihydrofolate reductase
MSAGRRIVVVNNVSLDGVMQAPARPDEDTSGGFTRGGWAVPYNDDVMGKAMAEHMTREGALLFGRRTYEDFFAVWPNRPQPNPFTDVLNRRRKYVASRTLTEPLPWQNSTLLAGDAATAVAELKAQPGDDIAVLGSGNLIGTLVRHDLVDEFLLLIHPVVLGAGRRLFPDDGPSVPLTLVDSVTTTTGVIIAMYRAGERTA